MSSSAAFVHRCDRCFLPDLVGQRLVAPGTSSVALPGPMFRQQFHVGWAKYIFPL